MELVLVYEVSYIVVHILKASELPVLVRLMPVEFGGYWGSTNSTAAVVGVSQWILVWFLVSYIKFEIRIWMEQYFLGGDCNPLKIFISFIFDRIFCLKIAESFLFITFQELLEILKCFCKPRSFYARLLQSVKKQNNTSLAASLIFHIGGHFTQRLRRHFKIYWFTYKKRKFRVWGFEGYHAESLFQHPRMQLNILFW